MTQLNPAQYAAQFNLDSIIIAMLASYGIQIAKKSEAKIWSWVTPETARMISAIVAVLSSAGINWQYAADSGTLVIHGLTMQGVTAFGWTFMKQLVFQDLTYRIGLKLPEQVSKMNPVQNETDSEYERLLQEAISKAGKGPRIDPDAETVPK